MSLHGKYLSLIFAIEKISNSTKYLIKITQIYQMKIFDRES